MSEKLNEHGVEQVDNRAEVKLTTGAWKSWKTKKPWPKNCPWPEPAEWSFDYDEDTVPTDCDEETEELLEIKEYFDSLVECGRLNEDYSLNEDYEDPFKDVFLDDEDSEADEDDEEDFTPEKGEDYWDDGFDVESWREDLSAHINLLQIATMDPNVDPVIAMRSVFSYSFVNENLLRQAFTRRAFAIEYDLEGCSEELEFLGDTVLSTVLTRELMRQFTENDCTHFTAPFQSKYNEGELTKLRQQFISKEALAARARELEMGKYILYGTGESETDSSLEDMMESLIGAVVIDSNWNMDAIERFVNDLLTIQLDTPDSTLKKSYYDILNAWHQQHFGCVPIYEVSENPQKGGKAYWDDERYWGDIRFRVPDNDKGIYTSQRLNCEGETRSKTRENAARRAYDFIVKNGLWKRLEDANIEPDMENSINQLQELYQKKYLETAPEYEYEDRDDGWYVSCRAESFHGWGKAKSKVKAKKKAAYMVIVNMLRSAGIRKDEWNETMFSSIVE